MIIEQTAILELFEKGGISMWPLSFLSILSLSTILERLVFWLSVISKERELIDRVVEAARYDWQVAQEIAKQASRQPIGRFLYAALRLQNSDPEVFRLALESAADNELAAMRRGEKIMEAVIALSPLLGLLGTVLGLINSLGSIRLGDIGTNATRDVTSGIGEALISTAAGLIVAIITVVFYRVFQGFLFSQMKMFRKSGSELELLYRQFWAETKNNSGLMLHNRPKSLSEKSEAKSSDFRSGDKAARSLSETRLSSSSGSLSGDQAGRSLSETPLSSSSGSLSGETGRSLSETPLSSSSGSLSGETGRSLSEKPLSSSSGSLSGDAGQLSQTSSSEIANSLPLTENQPSIPESLLPQNSITGTVTNTAAESESSTEANTTEQKQQEEEKPPDNKTEGTGNNVESSTPAAE